MIKKEIAEIKKQFTPASCSINRLCGCYVDGEKEIKTTFEGSFLSLSEEEMFKYFELFRKNLSGTLGKNLLNLPFPLHTELEGGTQEFLLKLRDSKLKDEKLLTDFYNYIIETFDYPEHYLILVLHDIYDIPGRTSDSFDLEDASDEVFEYIMVSICPVKLSKPGLSYITDENCFRNRTRDWLVEMPEIGFLFPSFNERSTDLHETLFYTKNPEKLQENFINNVLGCEVPLSAGTQKETFQSLISDTLGDTCEYEVIRNIHENLTELVEEHKEDLEPLTLDKVQVKKLLSNSGVEAEQLENFEKQYDEAAGEDTSLLVSNVANLRSFEVKSPDITIKVNPSRSDLVEMKMIDGRKCFVIPLTDGVEINGIMIPNPITD